jgi:hypothetical protein
MKTLPGYTFCVPDCFEASITQRNFQPGDTLYDTPDAYSEWGGALQRIRYAIQVDSATPGLSGRVAFTILRPNKQRTALVRVTSATGTQDSFIALLRSGDIKSILDGRSIPNPAND